MPLDGLMENNMTPVVEFLQDGNAYATVCRNAFEAAAQLSVDNWCEQIKNAILGQQLIDARD